MLSRRLTGVLIIGAATITGCVPFQGEPVPPIAVVRRDSTIEVLYQRCDGDLVKSVTVKRVDATAGGIISGPTLWEVKSSNGSPADRFTVGQEPGGFETTVPLEGALPEDRELAFTVETSRFEGTVDVRLADVRPGLAHSDGKNLQVEEFMSRTDC